VLSNGKRCPNEALPGSRYCGLPAHQALALQDDNGSEPADAPVVADEAPLEVEDVVMEVEGDGGDETAAVPQLAEVEPVGAGIPVEQTGDGDTEEHPPAA
jgi:N utilization substance protein A